MNCFKDGPKSSGGVERNIFERIVEEDAKCGPYLLLNSDAAA